jgi:REP-associated tyrosine transposase
MPQSLSKVILHIIFSTKNREPWLDPDVRPRMHAYLATLCRDLGAELVRVGGVANHVHIVTTLPRTVSQAQFVEQIKKASSKCHLPTH